MGFEQSYGSVDCVLTSEIDKFAVQTYQANFGVDKLHGDITTLASEDVPDHDILLAGFPCQPFSQAGLKRGFNDTRGTLFFDIERILVEKQPKAFLLENVKQLRGHDGGRTLSIILDHLRMAGYSNTQYKVLRARDFGVPQNRERVYIVGFMDPTVFFNFPEPLSVPTKVSKILEPKVDPKYTISNMLWSGHQRRKIQNRLNGKGFGYGLVTAESEYTNTISARYYKDGSEILVDQIGSNPRKLTPREAARLQGFPDTFKIVTSDAQAYRQFGNSVCVPVVRAIASQIKSALELSQLAIPAIRGEISQEAGVAISEPNRRYRLTASGRREKYANTH